MNKRNVGSIKELLAADYLKDNNLSILEMNYRNRLGEIDIIAKDDNTLVFVEVKYRKTASFGLPEEAVNYHKARTICKVADYYRVAKKINPTMQCRFDVVAICGNAVSWHKNAFEYII